MYIDHHLNGIICVFVCTAQVQTGNGWQTIEEDRTNFGALCVTSSPLILGMDVTDADKLARVCEYYLPPCPCTSHQLVVVLSRPVRVRACVLARACVCDCMCLR
jgi:hypothetical protein